MDYLRKVHHESEQAVIDYRHKRCRGSTCKNTTEACTPGPEGVPCALIKNYMFVREKAESRINYYTAEIAEGRKTPFDPPRTIKKLIYVGFRHEILDTIKQFIMHGIIAAATDEQICALFHCTCETDNADYEIENPVVLVWLGPHGSLALTLKAMNKLGCFADRYYFEQFKNIIVGTDFKPINDLSGKDSASTSKPINQKILRIIDKLQRLREGK